MDAARPDILMLTPDRQIDRRILLQADSLEQDGWTVTILAMPLDAPAQDDRRVLRIGTDAPAARTENRVLALYRWARARLPMNGRLMRTMKRFAWRYLVQQETFYLRLFTPAVARFRPRIVVAHDLPMLPLAHALAQDCGARLVYDSHELYPEQEFSARERRNWARIEAAHIGACDAVITVNASIAQQLEQRHAIARVHVVLNADRSAPAITRSRYFHQCFALAEQARVLLLQGGLSAGRNLEALVGAMAQVRNPQVVLVLLGDGLLLARLRRLSRALALQGRVFFHAAVAQQQLPLLTMAADAGVIPYQASCLNNRLCTPNKLFEFIAAGVPLLASDLPELRRFVHEGGIGLVGAMDSAASIAGLIDEFFADPARLEGWRARLTATRRQVCWEVEQDKLLQIYRGLA